MVKQPEPQYIEVEIPVNAFLPSYQPLLESEADIHILWGGRDSGKSFFISERLIIDCLQSDYFRCILIKKTAVSIKDSQWQLIKDICSEWGILDLFDFKTNPLEIRCNKNGNKFIARGCDEPERIKSISNPSVVWYEEVNQLTEADYLTVTTTLRSNKGRVKEWMSLNPECEGNYEDFWIYRIFFSEHYPKGEYSFNDTIRIPLEKGKDAVKEIKVLHTVYKDNPFCTPERIATHENLKNVNPYYYKVYTEGLWGKKLAGGEALKCFKPVKHVQQITWPEGIGSYNPKLALHLSFDENVVPYFPCGIFQIDGKKIYMIDEIAAIHPNNKVSWMCNEIYRRYPGHRGGVFVYGDATSVKDDVKLEHGHDLFRLIIDQLNMPAMNMRAVRRVARGNPSVVMSLNFFNTVLELEYNGIVFAMDEKCKIARTDFENAKEAPDGGIDKKKITDPETKRSYQPYGHFVDLTRYLLTFAFASDYGSYQRGGLPTKIVVKKRESRHGW